MITVKQELSELTNNFKDDNIAIKCKTKEEKLEALRIFREYYDIVEVSEGQKNSNDSKSWIIACATPKKLRESFLMEDDDKEQENKKPDNKEPDNKYQDDTDSFETPQENFGEVEENNIELDDLNDFDDPEDTMDIDDENLDSIDDMSEVGKADKMTVLKKRASDLAKKWFDIYDQITDLAKDLDLVVTHDDKLVIELKKSDGADSKYEQDLKGIENELNKSDEFDDDFGPSEFDSRAKYLQGVDNEYQESINNSQNITINETITSVNTSDPNEIPLRAEDIDDDF